MTRSRRGSFKNPRGHTDTHPQRQWDKIAGDVIECIRHSLVASRVRAIQAERRRLYSYILGTKPPESPTPRWMIEAWWKPVYPQNMSRTPAKQSIANFQRIFYSSVLNFSVDSLLVVCFLIFCCCWCLLFLVLEINVNMFYRRWFVNAINKYLK